MTIEAPARPSLFRIARERPLWILLTLVVLFFSRPLLLGQTFFFRDLTFHAFPQRMRLVELVRSSGLPLWDAYLHGGQPFLANVHNLALYPTGLLYFVLPPITAFNVEIVLHFLLCALAVYWLARCLGLSPTPSLVSGAAFTFCGFTLSTANLLNRLLAMPSTVFLILFWHLFLTERKRRWFLGAAASGVLVVLSGSEEFLLLAMAVALGWGMTFPYSNSFSRPQRAVIWAALGLTIFGVAAVQIWPQIQVIKQSVRGSGLDFLAVAGSSLNPRRLPELFIPGFLGPTHSLTEADFWGWRLEDQAYPFILSIYFGLPVLGLALGAASGGREDRLPSGFRRFLLATVGISVLLALGRFALLRPSLYRMVPFSALFRYPIKALAASVLPLALLAGAGAEKLSLEASSDRRNELWSIRILWTTVTILTALFILLNRSNAAAAAFGRLFFLGDLPALARSSIGIALLHAAAAGIFLALFFGARRASRASWTPAALACLVIVDLLVGGRNVNVYARRGFFQIEPKLASEVRENLAGGRFFRERTPTGISLVAPSNDVFWRSLWLHEMLDYYTASTFGIPVIFHEDFDGLAQRRLVRLTSLIQRLPWDRRVPLLSMGNVTVVLAPGRLSLPPLQLIGEIPNLSDIHFFLYRNLAAAPRVGFVSNWLFVDSETNALRAILSQGFDPRRDVVLEGPASSLHPGRCAAGSVVELDRSPTSWTGRVTTECDGYLVFAEPFYAGWEGRVDGVLQPILRANLAFSSMAIPAGRHVVSRMYRPAAIAVGAAFSLVSVVLTILLLFIAGRHPAALSRLN